MSFHPENCCNLPQARYNDASLLISLADPSVLLVQNPSPFHLLSAHRFWWGRWRNFCLLCNLLIIDQCPAVRCARTVQGARLNQFYFTLMRNPPVYTSRTKKQLLVMKCALKGRDVCVIKRTGVDGSLSPSMRMRQVVGYL